MITTRRMRVIIEVDYNYGESRFNRQEFNDKIEAKIHSIFPAIIQDEKSMRLAYLSTEVADEPQKLNHRVRI